MPSAEMNFAIRYLTSYAYEANVVDNLNALRVKPMANGRQRCDEFSVRLDPETRQILHRRRGGFVFAADGVHQRAHRLVRLAQRDPM